MTNAAYLNKKQLGLNNPLRPGSLAANFTGMSGVCQRVINLFHLFLATLKSDKKGDEKK
jgi:hypothetical protein